MAWLIRVDELRARADVGDQYAADQLTRLLARRGRTDELLTEVYAGTPGAAECGSRCLPSRARQGKPSGHGGKDSTRMMRRKETIFCDNLIGDLGQLVAPLANRLFQALGGGPVSDRAG